MSSNRETINQTEKDYWNEGKLNRTKIKKLRRQAIFILTGDKKNLAYY